MKEELQRRVKTNGLKYYVPTGKNEEVIREVGNGEYFIVCFSAANGIGKTYTEANILGNLIWPGINTWFDYPLFKDFPYPKRARIITTPKNLEEIGSIQSSIKEFWPVGKYEDSKDGKPYISKYVANDWVIDLMSYEQDPQAFESATLGVAIFDEPPPLKILYATMARMRQGGIILVFFTPLDLGGEVLEDLEEKETIEYEGKELGKIKIIYGDVETACIEHGVRGYLKHENILQMSALMDVDEKEARLKGLPTHNIGKVYKDFSPELPFVVEDFDIPRSWVRILAIDPHDAIPFAMTWYALDPTNTLWIYDEYPTEYLETLKNTNLTYTDYHRIIREHECADKINLRIIDPYFGAKKSSPNSENELTVKQELEKFGFIFTNGSTDGIEKGHMKVKERLKYDKIVPVSAINHPKLRILRRCRNNWRSMSRYKRKLLKSGEVKDGVVLEETYKHYCDNTRHVCSFTNLRYEVLIKRYANRVQGGAGILPRNRGSY